LRVEIFLVAEDLKGMQGMIPYRTRRAHIVPFGSSVAFFPQTALCFLKKPRIATETATKKSYAETGRGPSERRVGMNPT
jgi:hypothetical protein